ncbi:MAG: LamB/YcsF family protein [Anaerolineae bacterium]
MTRFIDLNCDMGESFGRYTLGNDAAMLDVVTSANVACGAHAGDPLVIHRTVRLAADRGVTIGAHPGYPDLQGFGRRVLAMSAEELEATLIYQLGALAGFTSAVGTHLSHVKPHGALYKLAASDVEIAEIIARAVVAFDPALTVVTQPGSTLLYAAQAQGLSVAREGFADRAYATDGTLVPRSVPGAVIHDPERAAERAVQMVVDGRVEALDGSVIPLEIDTLCVHGDTPNAPEIARQLRAVLETVGVEVRAFSTSPAEDKCPNGP